VGQNTAPGPRALSSRAQPLAFGNRHEHPTSITDQQFSFWQFVSTTLPICSARIARSGPRARDLAIPRELPRAAWGSRGPYRELLHHGLPRLTSKLQEIKIACIMREISFREKVKVGNLDTHPMPTADGSLASPGEGMLPNGTVLQDRYEILALIAIGGMGAVYLARDRRFSTATRNVAVKEINNSTGAPRLHQIGIKNFEREANILASLSHPSIPKIFDFFSEGRRSYLIQEFVKGQSLEDLMEIYRQPFSSEQVIDWAMQVCDVLAYLHTQSPPVIFRDIKPANLMLRPDGRIMVIDFGIAKVFEHDHRGTMIGTEGYSPPEQYRGSAEPRGDLYALGATMHHLLTARDPRLEPPFTFHERPIQLLNPNVPPALEAVIAKSLAYDLAERYSTATEMAMALRNALPNRRPSASPVATAGQGTSIFAMAQEIQPKWRFQCEDEVRSSPRVEDGILYIGCYDHNLYALRAQDGSFVWKFACQAGIASTPCACEDLVLIGSDDGSLYAVSRESGHMRWKCETGGCVRSSARSWFGHAFFGSDDGCLYAVNAQSGRVVWKFQSAGPIRSSPFPAEERIFVGSDDGYVYGLDMRTGGIKWKYNTNRRVTSSPVLQDDLLLIGSADGHLYALNPASGWPVWRFRTRGQVLSTPEVAGGWVFTSSTDGFLYNIDLQTGKQRWKYHAASPMTSSPTAALDAVYVGASDGTIHAVDANRGQVLWKYITGGAVPSSPLVIGDTLYIGSMDHHVYALPT